MLSRYHGGVVLLHCVSANPTPPHESNLRTIQDMAETFHAPIGLSDHSLGVTVPIASVAMGACVIEEHFTLSRADGGLDAAFSLEPEELVQLTTATRTAWEALGRVNYERTEGKRGNTVFRRSLYITQDLEEGDVLTPENLRSVRPGYGLAPKYYPVLLGRRINRTVKKGTALTWELLG